MRLSRIFIVVMLALCVVAVPGCGSPPAPGAIVGDPVMPPPADHATPEAATRSYLEWVSFAYRMANSEIATPVMTAEEWVAVDAYVQLNRQEGRAIEQSLVSFEVRSQSAETTSAVLAAREEWLYRYFSVDTFEYQSEPIRASYETTYTLVQEPRGWIVADVEATPLTELE